VDTTHIHLRQMADFDWSTPPPAVVSGLKLLTPRQHQAGDVVTRIRADLEAENRGEQQRTANLLAAATTVDNAVVQGDAPTWAGLCELARLVLGSPVGHPVVRSGPASCQGRRYGFWPGLATRFEAKMVADAAELRHPVITAVRLYLDVIHLHPFVDGNARVARLGLLWWLAAGGLGLPRLDPLIRLPKRAGKSPWVFIRLTAKGIHQCVVRPGLNS